MEPICEYCRIRRAVVYCKPDLARLCLQCDETVHSANNLSLRHLRSLLCNKCISQPAVLRCLDEDLCFCQRCNWNANCSKLGHRFQMLNSYTGCPSMNELASMWNPVLNSSSASASASFDRGWDLHFSSLPLNENFSGLEKIDSVGLVTTKLADLGKGSSSMLSQNLGYALNCRDHQVPLFSDDLVVPKGSAGLKDLKLNNDDVLYRGLNVDDVPLNFAADDEIFHCTQSQSKLQLEDFETDSLLMEKSISITELSGPTQNTLEASSSGNQDCTAFHSSGVSQSTDIIQAMNESAKCMLMNSNCDGAINLGFSTGQVPSTISLSRSNITAKSSVNDYQDCGLSQAFLTCDSSLWDSNLDGSNNNNLQARDEAKARYNAKKRKRTFDKQIRYASRKVRADTRKRVKGRFVKAGEAYDYDPLVTKNT